MAPFQAKANIISDIFGVTPVSASTDQNIDKTSQNRDLSLQANVSSSVLDKKNKNDKDTKDNIDPEETVNIVSGALSPASNPISNTPGIEDSGNSISDQVSVYVVRNGDSISKIAEMFNVSVNTILWANDLKKGEKLVEGDTLFILPVSGVSHTILKGQTLKGIAKKYSVDVSDIARLNGITEDAKLTIGDELIIPDAEMLDIEAEKPKNNANIISKTPLKILIGYFTNPVPNYKRKSQGLHGHNSVDLAAPKGTPIVAAAAGKVIFARNGYNGGYGNMVIINHPNGTQTLYAHMSKLGTHSGEEVNQGETIGYVGSTGHSTGPHLHFEVHGARNPAVDL